MFFIVITHKDSFIANLLRIIQHMQPKASKSGKKSNENTNKSDSMASKFPGLAIPNETVSEVNDPISDVMAELEAFAPVLKSKYDNLFFLYCFLLNLYQIMLLFIVALKTTLMNQKLQMITVYLEVDLKAETDITNTILEIGVKVERDTVEIKAVIDIGIEVVIGTIEINHIEIEVETVTEIEVKNVVEIEVKNGVELEVMTVTEIEIGQTTEILEEVEAEMDLGKKNMRKSMFSFFKYI